MKPFANDAESLGIGQDLTIENGTDRLSIYGSITFTRDQVGLAEARQLLVILQDAVAAMEGDDKLPAKIQDKPGKKVSNPFA
jgi:hypothetical protein